MSNVNIITITYNHEKFIKKTLKSFLMQKTNFKFNIIIADDCSTDGTQKIIEKYQKKYPKIIKFIKREKNIGVVNNYIKTLSEADAKYVIICEGDDYFTNKNKLQIQVDYLEKNPDKSICFHPVKIRKESNFFQSIFHPKREGGFLYNILNPNIFPKPETRSFKNTLNLEDLLSKNFIPTNSAMYRWRFKDSNDFIDNFPNNIMPCDYYLHLLHAKVGDIGFIDRTMAVYRIWSGGIWYNSTKDLEKHYLTHGIGLFNFYIEVAKNIAKNTILYINLNQSTIDYVKNIYLKNNRLNEIESAVKNLSKYQ